MFRLIACSVPVRAQRASVLGQGDALEHVVLFRAGTHSGGHMHFSPLPGVVTLLMLAMNNMVTGSFALVSGGLLADLAGMPIGAAMLDLSAAPLMTAALR